MLILSLILFYTDPYGSLQQTAIKIFSLVYLHFGKLQSNTFTEKNPKTDQKSQDKFERAVHYHLNLLEETTSTTALTFEDLGFAMSAAGGSVGKSDDAVSSF